MIAMIAVLYLWVLASVCGILAVFKKRTEHVNPTPAYTKSDDAYFRRAVEVAGGVYVGIQECGDAPTVNDLVLFNSPKTGSTLALKVKDFTAQGVANRIEAHEYELEDHARIV
jgi:hypothetical protein